jgi:hypothetical protein
MDEQQLSLNRRRFLECFSASGLLLMPGALLAVAQDSARITPEMLAAAEKIAGMAFTGEERRSILARLNSPAGPLTGFDALRHIDLGNTQPAFVFTPVLPGKAIPNERTPLTRPTGRRKWGCWTRRHKRRRARKKRTVGKGQEYGNVQDANVCRRSCHVKSLIWAV